MPESNYQVRQLVKVDIPDTYGRIMEVIKRPIPFRYDRKLRTSYNGGIVIRYMEPLLTMNNYEVKKSTYPLDHPVFGNAFHVVNDPKQEISRLEAKLSENGISSKEAYETKKEIDYLKRVLKKV